MRVSGEQTFPRGHDEAYFVAALGTILRVLDAMLQLLHSILLLAKRRHHLCVHYLLLLVVIRLNLLHE